MNNRIWLSSPHMGGEEIKYINQAFEGNYIFPLGPNVDSFESAISHRLRNDTNLYCAALSSGTAAIHLALRILNVSSNDVVFVQSFTFCGTTNPVSYQGAEIVFIDSELDSWNMCPKALQCAFDDYKDRSIKAVVPVHLYGMPARMVEIENITSKYNVPIIEDAAEALGSSLHGRMCGTFGLMAALSFNGNKIITTSEVVHLFQVRLII